MEHLTDQQKNVVRTAVLAGRRANATSSNRIVLPTGQGAAANRRTYLVLSGPDGVVTGHGEYYYHLTGEHPPDRTFDFNQVPARRGDSEYARDRSGREVRLRTLLPNGNYQYTALGRHFFRLRQVEHVVHVPVIIEGRRKNGTAYERHDYLPYDSVSVERIMTSALLTEEQRTARVRSAVLQALSLRTLRGRPILMEASDETYFYDRTRPWRISSLTTTPHDGDPETHASLFRPMGALLAPSFVPHADQVLEEAWQQWSDKLCVIRQLSALLKEPQKDLIDEFDRLLDRPWRHEGLSPMDVKTFCQERGLPYYCLGQTLLDSWVPVAPRGKGVAFCTFDGHCYMYRNCRAVIGRSQASQSTRAALKGEQKSQLPPISEWKPWSGPAVGFFYCKDLSFVRAELLLTGRNPKVVLRGLGEPSSLRYQCVKALDGCSGSCVIRELPDDREEIQAWARQLDVEWCGERLPGLTFKVLQALLKVSRRTPGLREQEAILKKQNGKCAVCSGIFDDDLEWDHVVPLKQLQSQNQKFQALCASCHAEKTKLEGGGRGLESRFSNRAWQQYVMSPRPPALVWKPHSMPLEQEKYPAIDVRRCRRNAMFYSCHEWSIFCCLDSIFPSVDGVLGDFSFVTGVKDARKSALSVLPFVGPGWYHRVAVEFLLHHDVVGWQHISHSFTSTGRLPADAFVKPLQKMEDAWGDSLNAKLSINMMIGLWAKDSSETFSVKSSRDASDGQGHFCTQTFDYGDGKYVTDFIFKTTLLSNASLRPLHDQVMHTEATRVAMLLFAVKALGIPESAISDCKTDCLIFGGLARKHRRKLVELDLRFSDLTSLRTKMHGHTNQSLLDKAYPMKGHSSSDLVFRYDETRPLAGEYTIPSTLAERPELDLIWANLDATAAEAHVVAGGSLAVSGLAGCGKTFWARQLVAKLREQGASVHIVAKTHVACQNFGDGAVTADHWVRKYARRGSCPCKLLVVEEFSQISAYLWNDLGKCLFKGVQFLLLGDPGQLDPIKDCWAGNEVKTPVCSSDLFYELTGGRVLRLTENRRSDPPLFRFYSSLNAGLPGERPLAEALAEARQLFPCKPGLPDVCLCVSHKTRMAVNKRLNQANKERATLYRAGPAKKGENSPQDMYLHEGLRLIVAAGPQKGSFVFVDSVDDAGVTLTNGVYYSKKAAIKNLRLCFCLTYAACQGLTLQGRVKLLETDHERGFTIKTLYVGSSRATSATLLEVS